jgi:hypothetical protein
MKVARPLPLIVVSLLSRDIENGTSDVEARCTLRNNPTELANDGMAINSAMEGRWKTRRRRWVFGIRDDYHRLNCLVGRSA